MCNKELFWRCMCVLHLSVTVKLPIYVTNVFFFYHDSPNVRELRLLYAAVSEVC